MVFLVRFPEMGMDLSPHNTHTGKKEEKVKIRAKKLKQQHIKKRVFRSLPGRRLGTELSLASVEAWLLKQRVVTKRLVWKEVSWVTILVADAKMALGVALERNLCKLFRGIFDKEAICKKKLKNSLKRMTKT